MLLWWKHVKGLVIRVSKPVIHFQSRHKSGNIFWLIGAAQVELRKQYRITDYNNMRDRVMSSDSYKDALNIMREYVDLIDNDGVY